MKKIFKKVISAALALALLLSCASALAEPARHERVFVVTDASGAVQSLTDSVRLENPDAADVLSDRTLLSDIVNVSGSESFTLSGETLLWQAAGHDIYYQGTADKRPPVLPVVSLTLDGKEVTAEELKSLSGEATLTVSYPSQAALPFVALSLLPLPESGVTDLRLSNAAVVSELGSRVLVGWAVPGADQLPALAGNQILALPTSFSASFRADHADLSWMMTFLSAEPVNLLLRELSRACDAALQPDAQQDPQSSSQFDLQQTLQSLTATLSALAAGEDLPSVSGWAADPVEKLRALNAGLTQLDDSAAQLAEGASGVSSGASSLNSGLLSLRAQSDSLTSGAREILSSALASANERLASAGLEALGLSLPELTAENEDEVLSALLGNSACPPDLRESVTALKANLDQLKAFAEGVEAYTDGVAKAAEGSAELASGAAKLSLGATALQLVGTANLKSQLLGAEQSAAEKLLPLFRDTLPEVLKAWDALRENAGSDGYDLRPEGMETTTVYIVRSDLR